MSSEEFTFKTARRQGVRPLIGMYSLSGAGKTYTALHVARGIAGPNGIVRMIDTESGRGSIYSDIVPGGYQTLELYAPFTPARHVAAITAAEDQGTDVLVIDSLSHEWEGEGGVLDWAAENEEAGKKGLLVWKKPKMEHQKLIGKLLQCRIKAVIVCIRGKYKSRQLKEGPDKGKIVRDDCISVLQSEELIFEMTAHLEIRPDHTITLTKGGHPDLARCFPEDGTVPLGIEHGRLIGEWCAGRGPQSSLGSPQSPPVSHRPAEGSAVTRTPKEMLDLKKRLLTRAGPHFAFPADPKKDPEGFKAASQRLTVWLRDHKTMPIDVELADLTTEALEKVVEYVENELEAKF